MTAEIIPFPRSPKKRQPKRRKPEQAHEHPAWWADFHDGQKLDLNRYLIRQDKAVETFFIRSTQTSMRPTINPGDLLVVDPSIGYAAGQIVIARLGDELVVRRLRFLDDDVLLLTDDPACAPVRVAAGDDFELCGVVTFIIHATGAQEAATVDAED
jgi:DNA polymerase V